MSNYYTIINSCIIIDYTFNKNIDFNLIDGDYDKIIFSNYNDVDLCLKNTNEFNSIDSTYWKNSYFNNSIHLKHNIIYLIFGRFFNTPFCLNNSLTHLFFGEMFNQLPRK